MLKNSLKIIFALLFIQASTSFTPSGLLNSLENDKINFLSDVPKSKLIDGKTATVKDFVDLIPDYKTGKYIVESHEVPTEDGYLLTIFNVKLNPQERKKLNLAKDSVQMTKPVFLQHGLTDCADGFFITGPISTGMHLVNLGFDVWAGNSRGTKYSQRHSDLTITFEEFYDYSWQEMGQYDVPANIKFIKNATKVEKIIYIGHSQGTTQMFVAMTDLRSANTVWEGVDKFIALSPVVFEQNAISVFEHYPQPILDEILALHKDGYCTNMSYSPLTAPTPSKDPKVNAKIKKCKDYADSLKAMLIAPKPNEPHYKDILPTLLPADKDHQAKLMSHEPSGTSWKCFVHYLQQSVQMHSVKTPQEQRFAMFDYGIGYNILRYGSADPPVWDLTKIMTPTAFIYGEFDAPSQKKDLDYLSSLIPIQYHDASKNSHMIPGFSHASFLTQMNKQAFDFLDMELGLKN